MPPRKHRSLSRILLEVPLELVVLLGLSALAFVVSVLVMKLLAIVTKFMGL